MGSADFAFGFPRCPVVTVTSWSNVDTDFPAANALNTSAGDETGNISNLCQMADTTGFQADLDLGAGYDDLLIAIDHVNFVSAVVKVDSAADFSSAQTFNRTIAANKHTCWYDQTYADDQDRLKDIIRATGSGLRYIRLTVASQAASDGAAYHFVGRIMIATRLLDCQNPDWGMTISSISPWDENERKSGPSERYSTGLFQYAQLSMRWEDLDPSYIEGIRLISRMRPDQHFIVWNSVLNDPADFYIVRRDEGTMEMDWDGVNQRSFSEQSMTEAIY